MDGRGVLGGWSLMVRGGFPSTFAALGGIRAIRKQATRPCKRTSRKTPAIVVVKWASRTVAPKPITQPAADASAAAFAPPPTSGLSRRGSPVDARRACPWGDVPNRAVQANVVVMLDVALHQTPRIFQRQWRSRPDALSFERFVPAFDLSVRLRIVGRGSDVRHARDPNELLEVFGDELRAVIRDDPGLRLRVLLLGCL